MLRRVRGWLQEVFDRRPGESDQHDHDRTPLCSLEVRAEGRRLEGYAALFDARRAWAAPGQTGRGYGSLARDIVPLVDHDPAILARTGARPCGSPRIRAGSFDLDVPYVARRDVLSPGRRGDLGGASFAFTVDDAPATLGPAKREPRSVTL